MGLGEERDFMGKRSSVECANFAGLPVGTGERDDSAARSCNLAMERSSVDFPLPLGPMSAVTSPGDKRMEAPSTTVLLP